MLIQNSRWDADADVVVIGYGAAGAVAAITASDAGAKVLVIEKQDSPAPVSSSFMSMASIMCVADAKEARRYMEALYKVNEGLYWTDPDIIVAWAHYCAENKQWLESMGVVLGLFSSGGPWALPGRESVSPYRVPGLGPAMMQCLFDQSKKRGVTVMPGLAANRLLENTRNEVIGVRAKRRDGKEINVQARRAVVLATGGFEFNEQMKLQYLPVHPTYFTGSPSATGDGIRMALEVGAQLWHMNCVACDFAVKFPGIPNAVSPNYQGSDLVAPTGYIQVAQSGWVVVDRYGKRYTNEIFKGHGIYYRLTEFDSHALPESVSHVPSRPRVPSYWVFDQKRMDGGALVRGMSTLPVMGTYTLSKDNRAEVKPGWIEQADTVKELAVKLGLEHLDETVRSYNLYCEHGKDPEFGRAPGTLVSLSNPPYYALRLWPGGPNTEGGPRRNARAQVINVDGEPIPRLYSAGELGSIYGFLYPGAGGSLGECVAFGRIAGENAAGQAPW